jgi:hypothetical protein
VGQDEGTAAKLPCKRLRPRFPIGHLRMPFGEGEIAFVPTRLIRYGAAAEWE